MMYGYPEETLPVSEAIFPALVTEGDDSSGEWRYAWTEQSFDSSGTYEDERPARRGTTTVAYATELSGSEVTIPDGGLLVWMRVKGHVGAEVKYEFNCYSPCNLDLTPNYLPKADAQGDCLVDSRLVDPDPIFGTGEYIATVDAGLTINLQTDASLQNAQTTPLWIRQTSAGTPAAGFGAGLTFQLATASLPGTPSFAGEIRFVWIDATTATRRAQGELVAYYQATGLPCIAWRLDTAANDPMVGFCGNVPVLKQDVTGSRSGNDALASLLSGLENFGLITDSTSAGAGVPSTPPTTVTLSAVPTWFLVKTITHADLTDADTSQDIAAYTLPAKAALHALLLRTKTAGSGGGVGSLDVEILVAGATQAGVDHLDGVVGNNLAQAEADVFDNIVPVYSWTATTDIAVRFTADVDVADLTGGEWEVYMLLSTLG